MTRQIDLLEGPILPSLWRFAAPFMLTAFMQMAYNLTDMIWIGRINSDAVAAAGTVGFLMWMGDAVSMIARTGMGVSLSHAYGRGDRKKVLACYDNGFQLAYFFGLLFAVVTLLGLGPFVRSYRLGPEVEAYAFQYGPTVLVGMIFKMINVSYSQAYQSLGNSLTPFRINVVGLMTNLVLDPIFIFGLGPVPGLGIFGAALATTLAQLVVYFIFLYWFKRDVLLRMAGVRKRPDFSLWKEMIRIGLPTSLLSLAHCLVSILLNQLIARFGAIAVAVTSVGAQLESLSWMTAEGFSGAVTSMVAQNYGGHWIKRVKDTMKTGLVSLLLLGLSSLLILIVFRSPLFRLFLPGDFVAHDLGVVYLLIFGLTQPFMTLEIGSAACFNGLGRTMIPSAISIILNLLRIPVAFLLLDSLAVYGVWAAMSGSTFAKGVITSLFLAYYLKKYLADDRGAGRENRAEGLDKKKD